jgi:pyruvate dehydrogenase E2 component (dihydrolipoyllysine-residue acetyltransferase)
MADVTMPKLSDTMDEGKILRWLKSPGDRVQAGEILAEVETDKADMELEASTSGVLREVRLGEGELAQVGAVIAVIEEGGAGEGARRPKSAAEAAPPRQKSEPPAASETKAEDAAPAAAPKSAERRDGTPAARASGPSPEGAPTKPAAKSPAERAAPPARPAPTTREAPHGLGLRVSPLARALAADLGVDLDGVVGTGPGGRITRADVEAEHRRRGGAPASDGQAKSPPDANVERAAPVPAQTAGEGGGEAPASGPPGTIRVRPAALARAAQKPAAAPGPAAAGGGLRVRRVPLSRMRTSIARRMAESKREAPHFYVTSMVEMDAAVELRASLKKLRGDQGAVTYNHMVLKAVADALRKFPEVNARFAGDAVELFEEVNLGVATAVEDGLVVPVVHRADTLSLFEIAARARDLAQLAEGGGFTSEDLSGATFSVSNLGMFDVESFVAVINPPQAAILAVGSVKQRPVVRDGALAVAHTMALTLSCDHRCLDGVRAARFLSDVKLRLENPVGLLVGEPAAE